MGVAIKSPRAMLDALVDLFDRGVVADYIYEKGHFLFENEEYSGEYIGVFLNPSRGSRDIKRLAGIPLLVHPASIEHQGNTRVYCCGDLIVEFLPGGQRSRVRKRGVISKNRCTTTH